MVGWLKPKQSSLEFGKGVPKPMKQCYRNNLNYPYVRIYLAFKRIEIKRSELRQESDINMENDSKPWTIETLKTAIEAHCSLLPGEFSCQISKGASSVLEVGVEADHTLQYKRRKSLPLPFSGHVRWMTQRPLKP